MTRHRFQLTRNDMARVIVQALYNLDKLPAADDKNVKKYTRWKWEHLKPEFQKAKNIINGRIFNLTRGGKREGAGRPKGTTKANPKKVVTVRLAPEIADFLKEASKPGLISQADLIETAVRGYFDQANIVEKTAGECSKSVSKSKTGEN